MSFRNRKNEPFVKPFYQEGIGRRTGVVLKTDIRKDSDGFEIFDDYFSESEADSTDFSFDINKENITVNSTRGGGRGKSAINSKKKSSPLRPMKSFSPVASSETSLRLSTSSQEKTRESSGGAQQNGLPGEGIVQNGGVEESEVTAGEASEAEDGNTEVESQQSSGEEIQAGTAENGEIVLVQDEAIPAQEGGEIESGEDSGESISSGGEDGDVIAAEAEPSDRRSRTVGDSKLSLSSVTTSEGKGGRTESLGEAGVETESQVSSGTEEAVDSGNGDGNEGLRDRDRDSHAPSGEAVVEMESQVSSGTEEAGESEEDDGTGRSGGEDKDAVAGSMDDNGSLQKGAISEVGEEDGISDMDDRTVEVQGTTMKDSASERSDEDVEDMDGQRTLRNSAPELGKRDDIEMPDENEEDLDISADGGDGDESNQHVDALTDEQDGHDIREKNTKSKSDEGEGTGTSSEEEEDLDEQDTLRKATASKTQDLKSGQDLEGNHMVGQGVRSKKTGAGVASGRKSNGRIRERIQIGHQIVDSPLQAQIFPLTKKRLSFSAAAAVEDNHFQETMKISRDMPQTSKVVREEDQAASSFLDMMQRKSGKVFSFRFSELLSSTALPDKTQSDGASDNGIVILSEGIEKSFMGRTKGKSTAKKNKKAKTILGGVEKTQFSVDDSDKTVVSMKEFHETISSQKEEKTSPGRGDEPVTASGDLPDTRKNARQKKRKLKSQVPSVTTKKSKKPKSNRANKTLATMEMLDESQSSHQTRPLGKKRAGVKAVKDLRTAEKSQDGSKELDKSLPGDNTIQGHSAGGNSKAVTIEERPKTSQEMVVKSRGQTQCDADQSHLEGEASQGSTAGVRGRGRKNLRGQKKKQLVQDTLQESHCEDSTGGELESQQTGEDLQVSRRKSHGDALKTKRQQDAEADRRMSEGYPLKKRQGSRKGGDDSILGTKETRATAAARKSKRVASQKCENSDDVGARLENEGESKNASGAAVQSGDVSQISNKGKKMGKATKKNKIVGSSQSESNTVQEGSQKQSNRREARKKSASEVMEEVHPMTENHDGRNTSVVEVAEDVSSEDAHSEAVVANSERNKSQDGGESLPEKSDRKRDSRKRRGGSLADLSVDATAGGKRSKPSNISHNDNREDDDDDENVISPDDLRSRLSKRWDAGEESGMGLASLSATEGVEAETAKEVLLKSGKVTRTRARQHTVKTVPVSTSPEKETGKHSGDHGEEELNHTKTRRGAKKKNPRKNAGKHKTSSSSDIEITDCTGEPEGETGDKTGQVTGQKTSRNSRLLEDGQDSLRIDGSIHANVTVAAKRTTRSSLRREGSSSSSNDDVGIGRGSDVDSQKSGPMSDSLSRKSSLRNRKSSTSRSDGDNDQETAIATERNDGGDVSQSKWRSVRRKSATIITDGRVEEGSNNVVIVEDVQEVDGEADGPCKLSIVEEAEENSDVTAVNLNATGRVSGQGSVRKSSAAREEPGDGGGSDSVAISGDCDATDDAGASPAEVLSADDDDIDEQGGVLSGASSMAALPSDTRQNDDLVTAGEEGVTDSQAPSDSDTLQAQSEGSGSPSTPAGSGEADKLHGTAPSSILKGTKVFKKHRQSRKHKRFRFSLFERPKSKAWIIPPEDGGETIRRSRRNRVRPLEWWRNERPVYERRKSGGFALRGIESPEQREPYQSRNGGRRRQQRRDRTVPITPKNLTAHCALPEDAEPGCSDPVVVVNPETQREVLVDAMRTPSSFRYVGPRGEEPKDSDDFVMTKTLLQQAFNTGSLTLRPEGEKGLQLLEYDTMVFYVVRGKLAVTIHKTTRVIESGSYFFVPQGNVYNIVNLRKDEAKLVFFQHKGLPGESFSQQTL